MDEKTKILIVDDEPLNLEFFDVMLSNLGFTVEKAEDGEVALEKVRSFVPDLILLDNIMPKLSGWEVTRKLKNDDDYENFRSIPVIMFSAMDDAKDKVEGFELGIEDYIMKPFNFIEILARIRNVLKVGAIRDELKAYERKLEFIDDFQKSLYLFLENAQSLSRDMIESGEKELHRSRGKSRGSENADLFVRKVVEAGRTQLGRIEDMKCRYRALIEVLQDEE